MDGVIHSESLQATVRYICTCVHIGKVLLRIYLDTKHRTDICTGLQVRVSILLWTGAWDLISPETFLIKSYLHRAHSQAKSHLDFTRTLSSFLRITCSTPRIRPIHVGIWSISKLQIIDTYQIPAPWLQLQVSSYARKAFEIKFSIPQNSQTEGHHI